MRRLVVAAAVAALAAAPAAGARSQAPPLDQRLARALAVPHISQSRSGAAVLDLATGRAIFGQNGSLSLAPASNEKLAVAYAAISALGPGFRFETDVLGMGAPDVDVFRGNLVLKGYGDPTLSDAQLRTLAAQVKATGIQHVTGRVVADETWFDARRTAPGWRASFYIDESPPLSALVVDRDRSGRIVSTNPALAAAQRFSAALRAAGVSVAGTASTGVADETALPLASVDSPPLASIVGFMNHESDNFTAEMLLKELGAVLTNEGTTAAGAGVVAGRLAAAGVPMQGVRIVDGSGLSLLDRMTANALAALLRVSWQDPAVRPTLLRSLPVAGVSGTLHDRMRQGPARGTVLAKTGTTREASALSGFVRDRYAFSILQNGYPLPFWWARVAQDRFATILASS
jgi:D-alanyl-D-alanine carboxypeptidase/D-alanyl-D-alanine-endopeptidase (penicillin-binding protein 4)